VAFPGETEAQFQDTLTLVADLGFELVNTAIYSPRPGTAAAAWVEERIGEDVAAERLQRLNHQVVQTAAQQSQTYLDTIQEILVEAANPKHPDQVMGRTRTNKQVFIPGSLEDLGGELVQVKITAARAFSLSGIPAAG